MEKKSKFEVSRRKFLTTTAAAAAITAVPFGCQNSGTSESAAVATSGEGAATNSEFGGVKIGVITYSFRGLNGVDEVLQACIDAEVSTIELMGNGLEEYVGAPTVPVQRRYEPAPEPAEGEQRRRRGEPIPFTPEEEAQLEAYNQELAAFRADPATMDKWAELRQKFNDAGIEIHILKWTAGDTDELLDYSFQVAKTLGAIGITMEISEEAAQTVGPAAERNDMLAIFHQHGQYAEMTVEEIEAILNYSPANRLNFDFGHYFGYGYENSTGLTPMEFIDHFAGMGRIASLHCKDKTGPDNETEANQNQVWGQGETPLAEVLRLVQSSYPEIYCDIELEYQVKPWSDPVTEVRNCVRYAKGILL